MSAHTYTKTHRHTPTHSDTHRQAAQALLLICCICYGAHLLTSSSMCVLSTEYICVCMCGVCVQQLHLYATYAVTIGLNVSLTRLASAT